jgi:hypothetical protein
MSISYARTGPSFTGLPLEISNAIFDLLTPRVIYFKKDREMNPHEYPIEHAKENTLLQLSQTCRQMRMEVESWAARKPILDAEKKLTVFDPATTTFLLDIRPLKPNHREWSAANRLAEFCNSRVGQDYARHFELDLRGGDTGDGGMQIRTILHHCTNAFGDVFLKKMRQLESIRVILDVHPPPLNRCHDERPYWVVKCTEKLETLVPLFIVGLGCVKAFARREEDSWIIALKDFEEA